MRTRLAAIFIFLLAPTGVLLSAGEAGAVFDLAADATCANAGNPGDVNGGDCIPFRDPFGDGYQYVSYQQTLTVTNVGTDVLHVTDIVALGKVLDDLAASTTLVLPFTEDPKGKFDDEDAEEKTRVPSREAA